MSRLPADHMPGTRDRARSIMVSPRTAFGVLLLLAALNVFLPYLAKVPLFHDGQSGAQLVGANFFGRDISYAFLFHPVRDFVRHHADLRHEIPLWSSNTMFGLPLVEQADFQLFNPLEWVNWLGGRTWWAGWLCVYLAWAGLGIFLVARRLLRTASLFALAAAAVYVISGTGMYALNYFAGLMNLLCLPFIVYHGTALFIRRQGARWHFAGAVAYCALLLTSGQPQYLALAALALALYFIVLAVTFRTRLPRLPFLVLAPVCGLLLAAPQLMPFLEGHLTQSIYGGNHALVFGPSYWRSGLITSLRVFAPHLTGPIGATWYRPAGPNTVPSVESFQIGFGLVAVLLIGCGVAQAVRRLWTGRTPPAVLQGIFCGLGVMLLAYVTTENLLEPPRSIWPFPFIHLNKYAPPVLGLFLTLGIPAGLGFLAGRSFRFLLVAFLPVLVLPWLIVGWLAAQSPSINQPLLSYVLSLSLVPVGAALVAAWWHRRDHASHGAALVLPAAAISDACVIHLQGLPAAYDYWRMAVCLLLFAAVLAAARAPTRRGVLRWLAFGAIAYAAPLGYLNSRILFTPADWGLSREIRSLALREAGANGEIRVLPAGKLIPTPINLRYEIKSLLNTFPIYPLATQGYYVRHFAPEILASQQRLHSFMNFYGMVDSRAGDRSSLSWQTYADRKLFFDLLGVDLLIDRETGELAALAKQGAIPGLQPVEAPELSRRGLRVYRSENSLHRTYFRSSYEEIPFAQDAAWAQTLMRERGESLRRTPLVEATYAAAPRWDGLSRPPPPRLPPSEDEPAATITHEVSYDGHVIVHVAAPSAGVFVLNEQYHPGWRARLNGQQQPILRVNTIAQGVLIPHAGDFEVEFRFQGTLSRDLLITLAGLVAASLGLLGLTPPRIIGPCAPTAKRL